jgi:very-short-patch-repair endonuclease
VYDRGGSRQNAVEAERVIDLIQDHAEERSDKSLGVVAFSSAQEQAIRDALEERREDHPVLDAFVDQDDVLDEFFIKNLEMVQGDERDRMIFSVGYGPAQDGTISTNFGPINKTGGERRLNVAVTRAKEHITVVSSTLPGEIDLSGSQSTGAKHFKNYLKYARQGEQALVRNDQVSNSLEFDSQFEEAVYDALEQEGYDVVSQVESSGYSIDLAIKHPEKPGEFILGIECDGAAYHSSKTARDRDRNRQMVLEDLGWNIHRIWSPDWTSNRERQIQQINEQVELLLDGNYESLHNKQVESHEPEAVASKSKFSHDALTEYEEPSLKWTDRYSVNKRGRSTANRNAVKDTVVRNGPIEYETAIQTELDVWSQSRAGKRVRRVFDKNVSKLERDGELYQHDGFLWQPQDELDFKVRVNTERAKRSIDKVPKEELAKAIAVILEEGGQMTRDDLELETTRLVGYQRRGKRIKQRIDAAISILDDIGALVKTADGKLNIDSSVSVDDALLDRVY